MGADIYCYTGYGCRVRKASIDCLPEDEGDLQLDEEFFDSLEDHGFEIEYVLSEYTDGDEESNDNCIIVFSERACINSDGVCSMTGMYSPSIPLEEQKAKLKEFLEPKGLWDESKCGIYTTLRYSY